MAAPKNCPGGGHYGACFQPSGASRVRPAVLRTPLTRPKPKLHRPARQSRWISNSAAKNRGFRQPSTARPFSGWKNCGSVPGREPTSSGECTARARSRRAVAVDATKAEVDRASGRPLHSGSGRPRGRHRATGRGGTRPGAVRHLFSEAVFRWTTPLWNRSEGRRVLIGQSGHWRRRATQRKCGGKPPPKGPSDLRFGDARCRASRRNPDPTHSGPLYRRG